MQENLWRETSFALYLIKQAINPPLQIMECIENWKKIQNKLSENPRNRKGFIKEFTELC